MDTIVVHALSTQEAIVLKFVVESNMTIAAASRMISQQTNDFLALIVSRQKISAYLIHRELRRCPYRIESTFFSWWKIQYGDRMLY